MKEHTKKLLGITCLFLTFSSITTAQILRVQARHVPMKNMVEFVERETTYWSQVAKKAIDDGHLKGWRMYRSVDGFDLDTEPNIFFVNEFTPEQHRSEVNIWNHEELFPNKEWSDIETFSLGTTKSVMYYYTLVNIMKTPPKFIRVNYAKTNNFGDLNRYLELEQSVWQPFIQERMDSGKTNVVSWGLASLIMPRGTDMPWDAISVDGFETLTDALWTQYGDDAVMPDADELFDVHHKAEVHVYELIMAVESEE